MDIAELACDSGRWPHVYSRAAGGSARDRPRWRLLWRSSRPAPNVGFGRAHPAATRDSCPSSCPRSRAWWPDAPHAAPRHRVPLRLPGPRRCPTWRWCTMTPTSKPRQRYWHSSIVGATARHPWVMAGQSWTPRSPTSRHLPQRFVC